LKNARVTITISCISYLMESDEPQMLREIKNSSRFIT
jgi:hypothetical protein